MRYFSVKTMVPVYVKVQAEDETTAENIAYDGMRGNPDVVMSYYAHPERQMRFANIDSPNLGDIWVLRKDPQLTTHEISKEEFDAYGDPEVTTSARGTKS